MKLASIDIEIADELSSPGDANWPPKIACAAIATHLYPEFGAEPVVEYFYGNEAAMSEKNVENLALRMTEMVRDGFTFLTWNGVSFDFQVIASNIPESVHYFTASSTIKHHGSLSDVILDICWHSHIDMMLLVTFQTGYRLSLGAALAGAGLAGKLHEVTLMDGTPITDMSGAKAPELWRAGERHAVLEYLKQDVIQPLELAKWIQKNGQIRWTSQKGRPMSVYLPMSTLTVKDAYYKLPEPENVGWMSDPILRYDYIKKYLPNAEVAP